MGHAPDSGSAPRRVIAVLGSGETSPTMVTLHRELVARFGDEPPAAVLLETPYGFQENVADISARARSYFARSVGLTVEVATGLRGVQDAGSGAGLAALRAADWVFSGPGSPTYALAHWRGSPVADTLRDHVRLGRAMLVFASAAACTLGSRALPVYEIYKAGSPPHWIAGLDLLAPLGLDVAVIPHYDNAEGGTHDTRYSYLGERRLRVLEAELPEDAAVLGVDEHTAVVIDRDAGTVDVRGRGGLTIRKQGHSTVIPAGRRVSLTELRDLAKDGESVRLHRAEPAPTAPSPLPSSLPDLVRAAEERFDAAAARHDAPAMVEAVLALDRTIAEWADDTEEDEGADWARTVNHSLIVRLGKAAERPGGDLDEAVRLLLAARAELRDSGRFAAADLIRAALAAVNVTVEDTPDGTRWHR
ncbi:CysS/YqeB C-terminal domain-containing protein [Actinocorallia populi]|uniref:CysS/YqeB C-terminal domain-containing protein n=1 Tax=Actinocorallia populi TaxID=2079200 RepID=UPI001300725F|nr:hypothetical protein [Actinocorallia populi]